MCRHEQESGSGIEIQDLHAAEQAFDVLSGDAHGLENQGHCQTRMASGVTARDSAVIPTPTRKP
jgi:hypothetical protein